MAKNYGASFKASALFDFARENVSDASQFHVSKFVLPHVLQNRRSLPRLRRKFCSFGNHDNRKIKSAFVTLTNRIRNLVHVEGALGNENYVSPACNSAVKRDPAGIAPHHF